MLTGYALDEKEIWSHEWLEEMSDSDGEVQGLSEDGSSGHYPKPSSCLETWVAQLKRVAQLNRPNPTPPRDGSKAICIGPMMTTGTWRQTADCSHAGGTQAVVLVNASDLGW